MNQADREKKKQKRSQAIRRTGKRKVEEFI
jgi:hypothetical protein